MILGPIKGQEKSQNIMILNSNNLDCFLFQGGTRIGYGARALNEGGLQCIPQTAFPGGVLIGCGAGYMNVPKIKGTHTAQKSGMLAAESIFDAIADEENQITEGLMLHNYEQKIKDSSIHKELHAVRNVKPAFAQFGLFGGMAYTGLFYVLGRGKQICTLFKLLMLSLFERRNSQNFN